MIVKLSPSQNCVYFPKDFSPFSKPEDFISPFAVAKKEASLCVKLPLSEHANDPNRFAKKQILAYSFIALQCFKTLFRLLVESDGEISFDEARKRTDAVLKYHTLKKAFYEAYRIPAFHYLHVGDKFKQHLLCDFLGFAATFSSLLKKAQNGVSKEQIFALSEKVRFAFFSLPTREQYTRVAARRFQLLLDTDENILCFIVKCLNITDNRKIVLEPVCLFYRIDENTSLLLQKSKLLFPPLCSPAALYLFVASEKGSGSDAGQTFSNTALEAT